MKTGKITNAMLCMLLVATVFVTVMPETTALSKKTIYVDTSGIDERTDLTATQKTELKDGILLDIRVNLELAVGEENVEVTNDPTKKAGASRKVEIVNSFGNDAWGGRMPGSDTAKVYLKEFLDDPDVADDFKTDGNWDTSKLANGIGHTAGHELGHTFCVGHNSNTGDDIDKMTDGGSCKLVKHMRFVNHMRFYLFYINLTVD